MDRRIAVPALFATAAAGVAYALLRLRRDRHRDPAAAQRPAEYRCACGQRFNVSGTGRHTIYWLPEASASDPVLSPECPNCERPLPRAEQAATA